MNNVRIKEIFKTMKDLPNFSEEELEELAEFFTLEKERRKQVVLEKGEKSDLAYYISNGCLRLYCDDSDGKEHTLNFATNGYWLADFEGFLNEAVTCMKVDTIIDTEYLTISKKNRDKMFKKYPQVESYFRQMLEEYMVFLQKKQLNDMRHDARQRYEDFCKVYPDLVGRVKDKHVASYIGVTPEFFSKMINSKQF